MTMQNNALESSMKQTVSAYWWPFCARGCIAVLFGIYAFFLWPILALGLLVTFFGLFILVQGVLTLIVYLKISKSAKTLPVLIEAVLGLSIGTFLFLQSDFSHSSFVASFVAWGIGTGICKVFRAFFLYGKQRFYWVLGMSGLLSILFNIMIFIRVEVMNASIVGILSVYFVVYGTLMIIFGVGIKTSRVG